MIRRERVDDLVAEIIGCLLYLIIIVLYVLGRSRSSIDNMNYFNLLLVKMVDLSCV